MLVFAGEIHHLGDFGFGDFIAEYTADPDALLMDMQHYARCLFGIHLEKRLQHMHDEFHRGVIVVQQQHFILAGLFGFGARARGKANTGTTAICVFVIICHENLHSGKIGHAPPVSQGAKS
jgi:uncharacterized NAD(P)/FAD-binding protein YdhS